MTCHVSEEKVDERNLQFRWLNYSGMTVSGPPFGSSYDQETGNLVPTDDYFSKIVAYDGQDPNAKLLELTEDDPSVQEFAALAASNRLSNADREGLKERFHLMIRNKGRSCSICHTDEDKSYLPFRALGFSDQRIQDVTNLNIIGIVEKYSEFYLPDLMKTESDEEN